MFLFNSYAIVSVKDPSPESASEEEPVIDEQPVSEENVPDTSGDPNRMMTPEEIEALFSHVS